MVDGLDRSEKPRTDGASRMVIVDSEAESRAKVSYAVDSSSDATDRDLAYIGERVDEDSERVEVL